MKYWATVIVCLVAGLNIWTGFELSISSLPHLLVATALVGGAIGINGN